MLPLADGEARERIVGDFQRTLGNQSAQRLILSRAALRVQRQREEAVPVRSAELPPWSRVQLRAIQRELARMGYYRIGIDGIFGLRTESGLVETFGGDEWRRLAPEIILDRLRAAHAPAGKPGEHRLRYGEMFRDGVLDMTLGIGFDEGGSHLQTIEGFQRVLQERGFAADRAAAVRIYLQAGRALGESAAGTFFVRREPLRYHPPAGPERPIHVVIRLVYSPDATQGGAARSAFMEGMAQSDISYYTGHGRYGSGPDFDRNMSFDLVDASGAVEQHIEDYDVLEMTLRDEGRKSGRGAWQQFLWRVAHNRIQVIGTNMGNLYLNPTNRHGNEFGGKLMYWNLNRTGGQGATPVTGRGGELDTAAAEQPDRKYRLMVFDGCRTQDYMQSLRATPRFDAQGADILATRRTLGWGDEVNTLAVFLDNVLAEQSPETIIRTMDQLQGPETRGGRPGGAYTGFGIEDNPVVRGQ